MTTVLIYALEMLCYSGNILSGIIALNIWRMQEKTLFNKMFMVYFAIDCLIGVTDPYYLFKLYKERSGILLIFAILSPALNSFWTLLKFRFWLFVAQKVLNCSVWVSSTSFMFAIQIWRWSPTRAKLYLFFGNLDAVGIAETDIPHCNDGFKVMWLWQLWH